MNKVHKTKYSTIMADPPWNINQQGKRGAASHYNLMTLEDIKNMPVADLCDDNAHLWLWVKSTTRKDSYLYQRIKSRQ